MKKLLIFIGILIFGVLCAGVGWFYNEINQPYIPNYETSPEATQKPSGNETTSDSHVMDHSKTSITKIDNRTTVTTYMTIQPSGNSLNTTESKSTDHVISKENAITDFHKMIFEYNNLFPVRVKGKTGFINKTGVIVIKPDYDEIGYRISEGTIRTKRGDLWGLINTEGEVVANHEYQEISETFSDGLVGVKSNNKWGYINNKGKVIVPIKYDGAYDGSFMPNFSEGLAQVCNNNKWGYIDTSGNIVIDYLYDDALTFSEGLAAVKKDDKWGYMDKTGKVTIDYAYDKAWRFSEGLAPVMKNDKYGFINKAGNLVIDYNFDEVDPGGFKHNECKVIVNSEWKFKNGSRYKEGTCDLINSKGNCIFSSSGTWYNGISNISDNIIKVQIGNMYGCIDHSGKIIINPRYPGMRFYGDGLINVEIGGKIGYIDLNEKMVIKPIYDDGSEFHEGMASVKIGDQWSYKYVAGVKVPEQVRSGKWGFINTRGEYVITPQYDETHGFINGLAEVEFKAEPENKIGYIDKMGRYIWTPTN